MSKSSFKFEIEPWKTVSEKLLVDTPIFRLFERSMKLDKGNDRTGGEFYILETPDWINVIALTGDEEIILVEQFRYGIEKPTLEIPGGMIDGQETALNAAKRELSEETGYVSDSWKNLGKVSANPAIMSNFTHLYLAEQCRFEGSENHDAYERINVHTMPVKQFLELVANGTVHHAIVLAAVAKYLLANES